MTDTTSAAIDGWAAVFNVSRKWHYFKDDRRSLCGKFLSLGSSFEKGNEGSRDNCAECRRRLAAIAEARKGK